jgi:hypothetical protein
MANNRVYVKRTSTTGRAPNTTASYATNTQYIAAGELALNMTDQILYTSDGTNLITVGSNLTSLNVSGNTKVVNVYSTGVVNAASHTVGAAFTANSSMTNTVSLVVSTNVATIGTSAYFVSNGNVGIGTSIPGYALHVVSGNAASPAYAAIQNPSNYNSVLELLDAGATGWSVGTYNTQFYLYNTANRFTIDVNGNASIPVTLAVGTTGTSSYTLQVNGTAFVNTSLAVGTSVTANATGVYTTGTVNAAGIQIGAATPQLGVSVYGENSGTGLNTVAIFNAKASATGLSVISNTGTIVTLANATSTIAVVNATGAYVTGTVNATSHTVGTSTVANSTGVYTGTVNAASHTVGTGIVANSTGIFSNAGFGSTINNQRLTFTPIAGGANVYFNQQNDDNFVFYSTNTSNQPRAIWSVYGNNNTSNLNIVVPLQISTNATVQTNTFTLGSSSITANNGYTRLPNGLLMQWGNILANTSVGNITFATAFTTIYSWSVTSGLTSFYGYAAGANATVLQVRSSQAVAATNLCQWHAIGV